MATIDNLDLQSISDMSQEEALEALRQLRLARRTPTKATATRTQTRVKKEAKDPTKNLTPEQAAELLKALGVT